MKKKGVMNGSYTVEAAVVLSVVFLVMASLIISAFYLHDCSVCQSAACEAAAAGSNFFRQKDRSAAAAAVKNQFGKERLLGSRNLSGNTSAGKREVSAQWKAVYPVPGFAMKYFTGGRLEIQASWKCREINPADAIRKIKGAANVLAGGGT